MQQESLRSEKDIKIPYDRKEKDFTCGENHFITRKRLNNYITIIIWLHPVKNLLRGWGRLPAYFYLFKNFQLTIIHSFSSQKNEIKILTDEVESCNKLV